eukprot:TRINITY_DN19158_c0_g1_i1.p1 TRINITY_DN19158_c0_g1~~TRINITY_DN19158_c0_g1_i1.p1  ORF type:complete len:561 (+),score=64.04 TRINITY_DN19158_c0_g1_i1:141-1823(+)
MVRLGYAGAAQSSDDDRDVTLGENYLITTICRRISWRSLLFSVAFAALLLVLAGSRAAVPGTAGAYTSQPPLRTGTASAAAAGAVLLDGGPPLLLREAWNETARLQVCGVWDPHKWVLPAPQIDNGTRDSPAPGHFWAEVYLNHTGAWMNFSMPAHLHLGIRRFLFPNGATMTYYGTADMQLALPSKARLAVLSIDGVSRLGINEYCIVSQVLKMQDIFPQEEILLITPKWNKCLDQPLLPTDLCWNGTVPRVGGFWHLGHDSDPEQGAAMSSYDVLDKFLLHLKDQIKYPRLERVVLMGHSGGGQLVARYALVTNLRFTPAELDNGLLRPGVKLKFVAANPSAYLYLDKHRWAYSCGDYDITPQSCSDMKYRLYGFREGRHGWQTQEEYGRLGYRVGEGLGNDTGHDYEFICRSAHFNRWPYGLDDLETVPYVNRSALKQAIKVYPKRDVVFLSSQNDTCTDDNFPFCDPSCATRNETVAMCSRSAMSMGCPAMLMGWNRHIREVHYMEHLRHFYGRKVHSMTTVPDAGHDSFAVFSSKWGLAAITGKEPEKLTTLSSQ